MSNSLEVFITTLPDNIGMHLGKAYKITYKTFLKKKKVAVSEGVVDISTFAEFLLHLIFRFFTFYVLNRIFDLLNHGCYSS